MQLHCNTPCIVHLGTLKEAAVESDLVSATKTDTVTVHVITPSDPKPRKFTFPTSETVGAAAEQAAASFGLHFTAPSFEIEGTRDVLDRSKTLAEVGVHEGEKIELVDVGGGV
jgi:hypothetical protein